MRKFTGGTIAVLLATAGIALTAAPASAHTPAASATCEAITVTASYYEVKPASGEPTIANPDYKPAVPGTPAVGEPKITVDNPDYRPATDAVFATEYLYKQLVTGKEKWLDSLTWNPGLGWYYAGQTRQTEVTPAQPAVGEPTIVIDNPAYVPAVPGTDAVGDPTIPNPAYVPGDDTPNTVEVTVDGDSLGVAEFGTDGDWYIPFEDKAVAHDWTVVITAWNDPTGEKGWTQEYEGTTTPCITALPATPSQPTAEAGIEQCVDGESADANGTITLPAFEGGHFEGADGEVYSGTLTDVAPGEYMFLAVADDGYFIEGEDQLFVTVPASEDVDCEVPPTEEPEEPTTPTTPQTPTDTKPSVTTTVARAAATDDSLAQTGADPAVTLWGLTGAALAVATGAGLVVLGLRRRQVNGQQ